MMERYKEIDSIMTIVAEIVHEVVKRKRDEVKNGGEVDMAEIKKCVDIIRDISEISLKMVKYEREIERYGGNEQLLAMQKTQDIQELFEEFKSSFSPKKLKDMIDMKKEDVTVVIEKTMQKIKKQHERELNGKVENSQNVYARVLQNYLKESNVK